MTLLVVVAVEMEEEPPAATASFWEPSSREFPLKKSSFRVLLMLILLVTEVCRESENDRPGESKQAITAATCLE